MAKAKKRSAASQIKVVDGDDEPTTNTPQPPGEPKTRQRRANYASFFEQEFVENVIAPRLSDTIKQHGAASLTSLNAAFESDHSLPDNPLYVGAPVMGRWLNLLGYSLKRTTVLMRTDPSPSEPPDPQMPLDFEKGPTFDNETPEDTAGQRLNPDVFGRLQ